MPESRPCLGLIDFSNLFHRLAFARRFALRPGREEWDRVGAGVEEKLREIQTTLSLDETIIACDCPPYWRNEIYPVYKAHRAAAKAHTDIDWPRVDAYVRDALVPALAARWRVVGVPRAEADDVIAVLAQSRQGDGDVIVVSTDTDFLQLQRLPRVRQYDPWRPTFLTSADPERDLGVKILTGDTGDAVGNVLMDQDACARWVGGERKPSLGEKKAAGILDEGLAAWLDATDTTANWHRNAALIDLRHVPQDLVRLILETDARQRVPADLARPLPAVSPVQLRLF